MSENLHDKVTFWQYIDPPAGVPVGSDLRHSRMLGTLILAIVLLGLLVILVELTYQHTAKHNQTPTIAVGLSVLALLVFAFSLNRQGRFELAAQLSVVSLTTGIGFIGLSDIEHNSLVLLDYLLLPILLASMILPLRATMRLVLVLIGLLLVVSLLYPQRAEQVPLFFVSFTSAMLLIMVRQRELVERDRQVELQESAQLFRTVFEQVPVGIALLDTGYRFQRANEALCELLGYPEAEILGSKLSAFIHPDDYRPGSTYAINDRRLVRQDGAVRHVTFNAMVLRNAQQTYRLLMVKDNTERLHALEEQRKADLLRVELERERELRDQRVRFSATVSHELRTPLTTILTSAEMIERYHARMNHDAVTQHVARVRYEVRSLTGMVDELLEISRSESGQIKFEPEWLNLEQLCADVVHVARQNDEGRHTLRFSSIGDFSSVWADHHLLQHSITNLIGNALKYTPEGGDIRLSLNWSGRTVQITIADTGIGIPAESLPQLFQPFYRASNVGGIKGTGLGLAIAYEYARQHSGTIACASTLGQGTVFTVQLPQEKVATAGV